MRFGEYKEIPILHAAASCGIDAEYNSANIEVKAKCPFCDDRRKHLYLNTNSNQFYCQRCGEVGNSVTLYAKVMGVDNLTAYLLLDDDKELPDFRGNNRKKMNAAKSGEKIYNAPLRPLNDRHDVYYDFLQMLVLSDSHRENLLSRGLDLPAIRANAYRTMPKPYSKEYENTLSELSKMHDLTGIPGFYRENGQWHMYAPKGFLLPVLTKDGWIQGMQIRLDDESKGKNRWFSSSFKQGGTACPGFIHVANWRRGKLVYITEGSLKADASSFLMGNACVIGLAGAGSINGLFEVLEDLGAREVIEALDMDKFTKDGVAKCLNRLNEKMAGTAIRYSHATWNPNYKGLDDFHLELRNRSLIAA